MGVDASRRSRPSPSPSADPGRGEVLFTRAKRTRSFEDVVDQIRTAILEGRLRTGDRLPNERDLCGVFGISRSTLREGLRTLEAIGIVEIRPGARGGIFVSEPGGDQLGTALEALIRFRGATAHDLAEFRVSFEGETAYWAALRATKADVEELEKIVADVATLAEREDLPWNVLAETELEFHKAIARTSKNQVRVAIMLGIHKALYRASVSLEPLISPVVRRSIVSDLRSMTDAIRKHDGGLARKRMRRHVKKFSDLESLIEEKGIEFVVRELEDSA